jgi:hypothetical protein
MCAVPNVIVLCSYLLWYFSGTLFRCVLNDSEKVPVALFIHGIVFAFEFHMHWLTILRSTVE